MSINSIKLIIGTALFLSLKAMENKDPEDTATFKKYKIDPFTYEMAMNTFDFDLSFPLPALPIAPAITTEQSNSTTTTYNQTPQAVKEEMVSSFIHCACGQNFIDKKRLKEHIEAYHYYNGLYICPRQECAKQFKVPSKLAQHMKAHTKLLDGPKDFKCICAVVTLFATKKEFNEHIKLSHKVNEYYVCPNTSCNKSFHQPSKLGQHIPNHKRFISCQHCGKVCKTKNELYEHTSEVGH